MRRFLLGLLAAVSAVLTVLSLPSVPSDVAAWSGVLEWVDGPVWRYALPAIGWASLVLLFCWLLYRHRKGARRSDPAPTTAPGNGEPRNRAELRGWLDARINELVAWRAALDEEIAKPVMGINRTQGIQAMFWEGLNRDVSRKLQLLAPEWVDYWDEEPDWFNSILTRITHDQIAEFNRFLGWSAERLRHIQSELP